MERAPPHFGHTVIPYPPQASQFSRVCPGVTPVAPQKGQDADDFESFF